MAGAPLLGILTGLLGLMVIITALGRPSHPALRLAAAMTAVASAATYLAWRVTHLPTTETAGELAFASVFVGVEVACLLSFVPVSIMLSRTSEARRRRQADAGEAVLRALPPEALPRVDVWIATYNEEWEILERTIVGALAIDWPRERLAIHVLDDGRRAWLARECAALGVHYVTRPDNKGRKAGNHNNALAATDAPFILSIDADFVVYPNILYRTIGLFEEADVAAVQTPQAYYNIDTTRRALSFQNRCPIGFDGIDMFYRTLQPSRDAWRASFYCGTSAVLRRAALEDVGGFVTVTDIEDEATSVKLMSRGWRIAFLNEVLSNGLAAESGRAYNDQRNRWCRGSLQILFTDFGPFGRGLNPVQRVLFIQDEWVLGALYPIVFAVTPAVVWLTGWRLYADVGALQAPLFPMILFAIVATFLTWVTQRLWLPILSQAIQLYTAVAILPTMLATLVKPFGKPLTKILPVTEKGAAAGQGGLNRAVAIPLGAIFAALAGAMAWRTLLGEPLMMHPPEMAALLGWTAFNLAVVGIALRAALEPVSSDREPWFTVELAARMGPSGAAATVRSLSLTGAVVTGAPSGTEGVIIIDGLLPLAFRTQARLDADTVWITFADVSPTARRALIERLYVAPDGDGVVPEIEAAPLVLSVFYRSVAS